MKLLLIAILKRIFVWLGEVPLLKTTHSIKWQEEPKPNEIYRILITNEFKKFMEHCQKLSSLEVAIARDPAMRNEAAIRLNAVHWVETKATEFCENYEKSTKPVPRETDAIFDLSDETLLKESDNG